MELKIGILGHEEMLVTENDSAKVVGSGDLMVFATPKMIALIEKTAAESVGATYKGRAAGLAGAAAVYSFNGNKIVTTHVSDYDFVNERHWLPGEGKIDWQELLSTFKAVEYSGPWLYEMSFACPKTIYRERDLTFEDFVRNAKEVFNNEKITVFSTPKEDLD